MELINSPLFNDANLVSYWRMEGNSNDSKGGNNGTDVGMSYGTSYGKYGQGGYFASGGQHYFYLSNAVPLQLNTFTANAWVKMPAAGQAYAAVISCVHRDPPSRGWQLDVDNGFIALATYNEATPHATTYGVGDLRDNTLHMLTAIKSGTSYEDLYIDGNLVLHQTAGLQNATFTSTIVCIGTRQTDDTPYYGNIDDLSFFNRVLTATEITNLYNSSSGFFAFL
jgi:hypothetical protein